MRPAIRLLSHVAGFAALAASVSPSASAADLDGSRNLVCAAVNVVACVEGPDCRQGLAKDFGLGEFIFIDFKDKVVRAHAEAGISNVSPIKNVEQSNTQLVLQGVETGHGWSISIDRKTGRVSLSLAGETVSYMIFGACTAP